MKRLIILLVVLGLVASAGVAGAANTVTKTGNIIEITPDGSTDWNSVTTYPQGLHIYAITLCSSAANDKISLRNGSATGAHVFPFLADVTGGGLVMYYGDATLKPFLKASECTFGTPANARIIIQLYKDIQ